MSYLNFKKKKECVLSILDEIKENIGAEYIKERIEKRITSVKEERFTIAVFGHFSNGKSTFLNALMGYGDEVLKEDEVASTATITRLVYPEDLNLLNKARIIYANNTEEIIDCNNIKEFTARNAELNVEEEIREVVVYFDSEFLKNGVEIVDTPGFNSTHKLHTDIAKSYIKKADASIFLFAADKPGAKNELQFLNDINNNLDRIFFILNKIDLCNFTEGQTIEGACDKLKDKLINSGIFMEGKKVYPISALKKKEAIKENSESKNKESMFDTFTIDLSNYLTSDENTKDRLKAPLNYAMKEMIDYKTELDDKASTYSSSKEDVEKKINEEKNLIKELEKELNSKKKGIDRDVKKAIKKSEHNIKEESNKLDDDINDILSKVKSRFSTNLYKFNDINESFKVQMIKVWQKEKIDLEYRLDDIIEENIDDDKKVEEARKKIMPIINETLKIQNISVSVPEFNFEMVKEIDDQIEKCKAEYKEARKDASKARSLKIEKDIKTKDIDDIKIKIKSLEEERRERLSSIGEANIVSAKRTVKYEEERSGIFGWVGNKLFGSKEKEREEDYTDYTHYNHVKKERSEIEKEYAQIKIEQEKALEIMKNKVCDFGDVEHDISSIELDEKLKKEAFLKKSSQANDEKTALEQEIISMTKSQYKDELRNMVDNFQEEIILFLKGSSKFFSRVITEFLDNELKEIERHKERMYDLSEVNDLNPSIIESKMKDVYINIDKCNSSLSKLRDVKGSL